MASVTSQLSVPVATSTEFVTVFDSWNVELEEDDSKVDTTGVVVDVGIELTALCVVSVEVCMGTVGFPVEEMAKDEVSGEDSIEEVTERRVELGVGSGISVEEGISSVVIVEAGGRDSVEGVDAALSV